MYKTIRSMKTTRAKYAEHLVTTGVLDAQGPSQMMDDYRDRLDQGEQVADGWDLMKMVCEAISVAA